MYCYYNRRNSTYLIETKEKARLSSAMDVYKFVIDHNNVAIYVGRELVNFFKIHEEYEDIDPNELPESIKKEIIKRELKQIQ